MRIQKPEIRRKPSVFPVLWTLLLIVLLISGVVFFFFRFQHPARPLYPYEIQNLYGKVDLYAAKDKSWGVAQRGATLSPGDIVRTSRDGEAELQIPGEVRLRLKENSEMSVAGSGIFDLEPTYRVRLQKGVLLGATEKDLKDKRQEIKLPGLAAQMAHKGILMVEAKEDTGFSFIGVLRGTAKVKTVLPLVNTEVHSLEKVEALQGDVFVKPVSVSRGEWDQMKEAYELVQKSAAAEAEQLDLSKKTGNFFHYVFDHGTFFTPKIGYCLRDFILDKETGEVRLETEYDVFPAGSFVGVYMKTRNLDISNYKMLKFEIRRVPDEGYPESFRIELKSPTGIARAFAVKDIKKEWKTVEFPLLLTRSLEIRELTLVFSNDKAGSHKKGTVAIRNVTLVPADKKVAALAATTVASTVVRPKIKSNIRSKPENKERSL